MNHEKFYLSLKLNWKLRLGFDSSSYLYFEPNDAFHMLKTAFYL